MTREALQRRILTFMDATLTGRTAEPFEALLEDVHAWQIQHAPVVAALTPPTRARWTDIPAVPVSLFKEVRVGAVPEHVDAICFRTSGTTGGGRGEHHLYDTVLYDHGALAWARRCLPTLPRQVVALLVDPRTTPDASLSHMVRLFAPDEQISWHLTASGIDHDALRARLRGLHEPVFVATTAFALADWLDTRPPPLPPGSVLMVTGGFKGRRAEVAADTLYEHTVSRLQPAHLVTEYGMTELSSQLWGTPDTPYRPPPWMRVVAVSPATGEPQPVETAGQLRFYDLANLDSSVGVETLDRGVLHADGSVTLLGRLADAEARGCSLTAEEALQP